MAVRTDSAAAAAPKHSTEAVALMFSGGLDSAAAAVLLAEDYRRVHLLTYDNGHGHLLIGLSRGTARDLQRATPGVFSHRITPIGDLFRRLVTGSLAEEYNRYGSRFIWCMGCKMAMHAATIAHCLRNGVAAASDGSSRETRYFVEQSPIGLRLIKGLYHEHGIAFVNPIHQISTRGEEERLLANRGVRVGRGILGRNPGTQPLCLPGNVIYMLSMLLNVHPSYVDEEVIRFFEDKAPLCREYIERNSCQTR